MTTSDQDGGAATDVLTLLGSACDQAIADTSLQTIDQLSTTLTPCCEAELWIECRSDEQPPPGYSTVCPAASDTATWMSRYQAVNQRWMAMNGSLDLTAVSFAVAALAPSRALGVTLGSMSEAPPRVGAGHASDPIGNFNEDNKEAKP
ncbi:MAG: hypothetical protein ABSC94_06645 [Polyangiaceae bacterium]